MNMKSIFTFLAVLALSLNVFAVEIQEEPEINANNQLALNQKNPQDTYLASHIVNSPTVHQASTEPPSEFITALSVYLIIIIVYSIYGFKANSKNIGH